MLQPGSAAGSSKWDRLLGALVGLLGLFRLGFELRLPDSALVRLIPDDAFYYLAPARNFARLGRWTFDGVEPASGFHLLWGYLLAALFRVCPDASLHTILAVGGGLQVLCLALAAWLAAVTARRLAGPGCIPGVAMVFCSAAVLEQGTWLMESSLVMASAAAVVFLLARTTLRLSAAMAAMAFVLGALLMFSRSDAGLLALVLLVAAAWLCRRRLVSAEVLKTAAITFLGSCTALGLTLLHTHWVSGQWVQSSARMKLFWAHLAPERFAVAGPAFWSISFFDPLFNDRIPFVTNFWASSRAVSLGDRGFRVAIVAVLLLGLYRTLRTLPPAARGLLLTMLAVVAGYCALYSQNGAVQAWYVANFAVPVALLAGAASAWFARRHARVVQGLAAAMALCGLYFSLQPTFPWQEVVYRGGVYLQQHPELGTVGSFNAGILGFYAPNRVTNLDGLVNDSIYPYATTGRLVPYLAGRKLDHILEWPAMLYVPGLQAQGGHTDGRLLHCLRATDDLFPADPDNIWAGGHLSFYTFDAECLQSR